MPENVIQPVDILLVVPLSEEFNSFRDIFDFKKPVFFDGTPRSYYLNPNFHTDLDAITSNEYSIAAICLVVWTIASGHHKIDAVAMMMKNGLANAFVIDKHIAEEIIAKAKTGKLK